jgi:hypothetical protein
MPEYRPLQSAFGALWLHPCPALDYGPDWAQRERLLIDSGPRDSRLKFQGRSIPLPRTPVPENGRIISSENP